MADLLECVIQIKALREALDTAMGTRSTFGLMPAAIHGGAVWRRMAEAERRYTVALGTAVAGGAETAPSDDGPGANRARFVAWRQANLAMLERCSAAELAGFVEWTGRSSTSVADLVAIMLANDTEELGELRRAGARRSPWPEPVEGSESGG